MPRYFFHISNKQVFAEDCEGRELPDLHAALEHVEDTYRQLALKPSEARGLAFTIADNSGRTLLTVPVPERQCQSLSLHIEDAGRHWIAMSQAVPGHFH
jgi:hypothetical protein